MFLLNILNAGGLLARANRLYDAFNTGSHRRLFGP